MGIQPGWHARQLVFIDESAANERTRDRKYGWSPQGFKATDILPIKRSQRWSILPALTVDGYLDGTLIYQGSITADIFESWIENTVLPQCGSNGGDRSILIMDNASIHKSNTLKQLCIAANVDLVFLPPYSPDFNPIEATFGDLKAWVKRNYLLAAEFEGFGNFLTFAVEQTRGRYASQHFRKAGYIVSNN
jgi:transposase